MKKLVQFSLISVSLVFGLLLWAYLKVEYHSSGTHYSELRNTPHHPYGLVLGTAKYQMLNGKKIENPYYQKRIKAAHRLWRNHIVDTLLLSGDNSTPYYDEPGTMKTDLMALGVLEEDIILDGNGLGTFESVTRTRRVYHLDNVLIISQSFQNKRALYIASHTGLKANAFNADSVELSFGLKTEIREVFARVKMFLDLFFNRAEDHHTN